MRSLAALALALLAAPLPAHAKSQADLDWPLDEVFGAALRFVRVDRGCKVVDRDEKAAYVMFECDDGRSHGGLELFRARSRAGAEVTRAEVTLKDEPRYVELRFLELLERKLRDERGAPQPARREPPTPSRDGGA